RRPHDHIELPKLKSRFHELMGKPVTEGGYGKSADDIPHVCPQVPAYDQPTGGYGKPGEPLKNRFPTGKEGIDVGHGDVLISAIPSCTNPSNPGVLLGAGLLAKKAAEKGLKPHPRVKTSLAPGSRAVTAYLENSGLMPYLNQLGYFLSGYG